MCGSNPLKVLVPNFAEEAQQKLFPKPNLKFPKPPAPPKEPAKNLKLAEQHAKEAAIGAYGSADTFLTGGKGLGAAGTLNANNLWKQLGGS